MRLPRPRRRAAKQPRRDRDFTDADFVELDRQLHQRDRFQGDARTSASGPFIRSSSPPPAATSDVDATALANTTIFDQIVATNSVGDSTPSNQMQVTTPQPVQSTVLTSDDIGGVSPAGMTDTITDGSDYDITAGGENLGHQRSVPIRL